MYRSLRDPITEPKRHKRKSMPEADENEKSSDGRGHGRGWVNPLANIIRREDKEKMPERGRTRIGTLWSVVYSSLSLLARLHVHDVKHG